MLIPALIVLAVIIWAAREARLAPVTRPCRKCGEPCAIGICAACDTPQSTQQRRAARGVHINSARLTNALLARTAVRGDSGMVTVRGRA
ncbi:hypothetical protein GCM10008956_15120 [Deinococcus arenae]|uniref:Uncharacterized protein n=1 Tax=Deinococcus arenae TaxID=1452751 RepID=A0A8H9L5Q1_9DEIO|nr:hypothetical protein [Deinococcus arenae]GGM39653.1 hypothetical protein GCM10008956_15120 [Deinococcus arenae]